MKGWGHEDIELAARFINTGLRQKKVKMLAIAYHLHHTYNDRRRAIINYGIYQQTVLHKLPVCSNGYAELQEYTAKSATGLE